MRTASSAALVAGLVAVGLLVAWQGIDAVAGLLASAHWTLVLVSGFALPSLLLATASWRLLFPPGRAPRFGTALGAMWVGSAVNNLLPVASVGGEAVRARLLTLWSGQGRDAVASVVVDKTVQAATSPLLGLVGAGVLLCTVPDRRLALATLAGVGALAAGLAVLVLAQHAGPFVFLARWAALLARSPAWDGLVAHAGGVDEAIRALYRRRGLIVAACGLRVAARLVLAADVWVAAWLMGHPISAAQAVLLASLTLALRAAAFVVPGGLGVQEASFVALGTAVGLPADLALALSLAIRIREVVPSIPGLLAWQIAEGGAVRRTGRSLAPAPAATIPDMTTEPRTGVESSP